MAPSSPSATACRFELATSAARAGRAPRRPPPPRAPPGKTTRRGVGVKGAESAPDTGRAASRASDDEALEGFRLLARMEGILPALESSHALGWVVRERERLAGRRVLIGLSGRGDKDLASVLPRLGHGGEA